MNDFYIYEGELVRYLGSAHHVVVPSGVTKIGDGAFLQCWFIKSIVFPEGVTEIGKFTFGNPIYEESQLQKAVLPESLVSIGAFAFYNCKLLSSVNIPNGLKNIGTGAFTGCNRLADENGVVIIKETMFDYIGSSETLVIPDGVKTADFCTIHNGEFKPRKIVFPDSIEFFGEGLLNYSTESVVLPNMVQVIPANLFYGWEALNSVTMSVEVETIEELAFVRCKSLKSFSWPQSLKNIGNSAFCDSGLEVVVIPDGVEQIGDNAFANCKNLNEIVIPASVKRIGKNVFRECTKLTKITTSVRLNQSMFGYTVLERLEANDINRMPKFLKIIALATFIADGADINSNRGRNHLKFIKNHISGLIEPAIKNKVLLDYMLDNKLLNCESLGQYIEYAIEHNMPELAISLTDYQLKTFPDDGDGELKKKLGI